MKKLLPLLLFALPALAQPAPVPVYFAFDGPGANRWLVDNAMHVALERPEVLAAAKRDNQVLEVTVVGKIVRDSGPDDKAKRFTFTLGFYRAGERLGEASEYCNIDKLGDCADQLVSDITGANAIRR